MRKPSKKQMKFLKKAGYELVKKGTVKRTYVYPDLHPDMQDLMDLNIPLWVAPLWQKKYPANPPVSANSF